MGHKELMVGNKAVAYGAMLSKVQVTSAYPITPQTTIVEYLADFIASGRLDAKFIEVESEMSAQISVQGASWAGHVAVVEKILSNGHVIASNMSWGAHPWQVTYVEFAPGPGVTFIYR